MVNVERKNRTKFFVSVEENGTARKYSVILESNYYKELAQGNITEEDLIKKSFEFLLKRESKESILPEFNLKVISTYFPEFEREIKEAI